jgi:hypothetical protein
MTITKSSQWAQFMLVHPEEPFTIDDTFAETKCSGTGIW